MNFDDLNFVEIEDKSLLKKLKSVLIDFIKDYNVQTIDPNKLKTTEPVDTENFQISHVKYEKVLYPETFHCLIGGDWQQPWQMIFGYREDLPIKPIFIYQSYYE